MSFCQRWFNSSIQTSKQRRYSVRRFDLKFRRCFNVGLKLLLVDEIDNVTSTLFQRRKSYVNPICIFNLFSTSVQRRKDNFQRWFNVETTSFCPLGIFFYMACHGKEESGLFLLKKQVSENWFEHEIEDTSYSYKIFRAQ